MRAVLVALLSAVCTTALCEQGTGFDPNLRIVVSAEQVVPGGPAPRGLVGADALSRVCAELEVAGVFRCESWWSDGMSGFALSDNNIAAEVSGRVNAEGVRFAVNNDIYQENPVGIRSRPPDRPPRCSRSLGERPASGPREAGVLVQAGATDALSFMSAYARVAPGVNATCFPGCQDSSTFRYRRTGKGVTVYIVDQAVSRTHEEFKRAGGSVAVSGERWYSAAAEANTVEACGSWHGTHVAGLAAGNVYGVAKDARVVSVAVQPGCQQDGRTSDLIAGLDWVLERHRRVGGPAIVSMSLIVVSSGAGSVLELMVQELIDAGVIVVVAAGNFADDACNYMPANLDDVITVAAAQLDVVRGVPYASAWASSNTGACVTVWAPGAYVESASSSSDTETAVYSGTSQATPLVSGVIAQFLEGRRDATVAEVRAFLKGVSVEALTRVPAGTAAEFAQVAL